MVRGSKQSKLTPEQEAEHLLKICGGTEHYLACIEILRSQFNVIQARSQLLLTLSTLALTITGFSGPKIAQTNLFARVTMAAGIIFVLAATIVLLAGGLRIRWITQFTGVSPADEVAAIIRYRDQKTRLYALELTLLVIGLASYVASVVTYLVYAA